MSNQSSALICGERPPEQGPRFIIKEQQVFHQRDATEISGRTGGRDDGGTSLSS